MQLRTMNTCLISTGRQRSLISRVFSGTCAALLAIHPAHAEKDAAKVIETAVGKQFTIELESNITTGYAWKLQKPIDKALLHAVGNEYRSTPPAPGEELVEGAGGKEFWTFKALQPGQTTIDLIYVSPFSADEPPARTASFRVVIKGASKAATPAPDHPPVIKKGAGIVLKGRLQGGMMGIGGETTGWRLTYPTQSGTSAIEVDFSNLKDREIPEGEVRVTGKVIEKAYVERGPTLILKATKVEKQP